MVPRPISVRTPMGDSTTARLRAGFTSGVVAVLVFAVKLAAWRLTGSTAVLSDALESIVNIVAGGVLVLSLWVWLVALVVYYGMAFSVVCSKRRELSAG